MSHRSEQIARSKQRTREKMAALQKAMRAQDAALRTEARKAHQKRLADMGKYMEKLGFFAYEDAAIHEALDYAYHAVLARHTPHEENELVSEDIPGDTDPRCSVSTLPA